MCVVECMMRSGGKLVCTSLLYVVDSCVVRVVCVCVTRLVHQACGSVTGLDDCRECSCNSLCAVYAVLFSVDMLLS